MQSESASPGDVNRDLADNPQLSRGVLAGTTPGKRPVELAEMALRLNGYLRGAHARGTRYVILDPYSIARLFGKSVAHVRRSITAFRRQTTLWQFEDIYHKPCDRGATWQETHRQRAREDRFRRHRRIKVSPAGGAHTLTQLEVAIRLIAYLTAAVRRHGRAHVDREFLRRFQETSGLPPEWIALAWQRCKKIKGYRCRWRGVGAGRKLVVEPSRTRRAAADPPGESMQHFPPGLSFPYGKEDQKQRARCALISQTGNSGGSAEPHNKRAEGESPRTPSQAAPDGKRPSPSEIDPAFECDGAPPHEHTPDTARGPADPAAVPCEAFREARDRPSRVPVDPPFQVAGRWISGRKLTRLAAWLAVGPMRAAHVQRERVTWRFAHAHNFARRNLRNGYTAAAIVAAYRSGVERSHNDSLDRDKAQIDRETRREPRREPSAAVVYAAAILGADARPAAQRWAEFFAAPVRKVEKRESGKTGNRRQPITPMRPMRHIAPGTIAELRAKIARPIAPAPALTLAELHAALARRGLSVAQFAALPWAHRMALIRRVTEKKHGAAEQPGDSRS